MTLLNPKAVLFDWDNTLVNTWPVIHEALHNTLTDMGHTPWTLAQVKEEVKHSMRDSFPHIFGKDWERAGALYQQYYQAIHLQKLEALPLAEDVLRLLSTRPVYVAVVSNKRGPNLRKEAEHLGWSTLFHKLVGADDAARDKPHSDPVHLALEGSGVETGKDVWFVGDSVIDLECAKNTGCTPILYGDVEVETHPKGHKRYKGFDAMQHIKDHASLLALLRSAIL